MTIIDCFAGGGGASTGIEQAVRRPCDIAVNHDPKAIAMHRANHPRTHHVTEDIFKADLRSLVSSPVTLLWASPDCTSHSRAKGSTPRQSGTRMLPWAVHRHAKELSPDVIIMENVPEIQRWGPLGADGMPIRSREGEEYRRFVDAMGELGYSFDSRELKACDYGAPTSRTRWYAVMRRSGRIRWPEPTHGDGLYGLPYDEVANYIDFENRGTSIYRRSRPIARSTMGKISRAMRKYPDDRNFLLKYYGCSTAQSVHAPLDTITTKDRFGLVTVADGDVFLRMLTPEELKCAQGFPRDYIIDRYDDGNPVPRSQQVKMIGNSVVPVMARRLVEANA